METINPVTIPTPFDVGRVNCYLFMGNGITVLDPGPATDEAYEELATQFDRLGYAIVDIERVLITHPHMDHFGIVNRLTEESGAQVLAHMDARERLSDPLGYFTLEQEFFAPFLLPMGLPEQFVDLKCASRQVVPHDGRAVTDLQMSEIGLRCVLQNPHGSRACHQAHDPMSAQIVSLRR